MKPTYSLFVSFAAFHSLVKSNSLQRYKVAKMNHGKITSEQGYVPGKPVSAYSEEEQKLRWEDREEAITSLLELVDATEEDSLLTGLGVVSAYYEQLAMIYRRRKEYIKEIAILARYASQRHAYGDSRQQSLKVRLKKAKKLFTENKYPD